MEDGSWRTQTERLLLMDSRDFNSVGIGLDDLIEAYMQTCLSMAAIDVLAGKLVSKKTGRFCYKLFEARLPCISGTFPASCSGTAGASHLPTALCYPRSALSCCLRRHRCGSQGRIAQGCILLCLPNVMLAQSA